MSPEERATELRAIVTNAVFKDVMDDLERDAFNMFMALDPVARRSDRGAAMTAHIDALRNVRARLNSLASIQSRASTEVV